MQTTIINFNNIICDMPSQQHKQASTDVPKKGRKCKMTQTGQVRSKKTATAAQIESFENTIDCVGSQQCLGAEDNTLYSDFSSDDDVDVDNQSSQTTLDPAPDAAVIATKLKFLIGKTKELSRENDLLKVDNIRLKASLDKVLNQISFMMSFLFGITHSVVADGLGTRITSDDVPVPDISTFKSTAKPSAKADNN